MFQFQELDTSNLNRLLSGMTNTNTCRVLENAVNIVKILEEFYSPTRGKVVDIQLDSMSASIGLGVIIKEYDN